MIGPLLMMGACGGAGGGGLPEPPTGMDLWLDASDTGTITSSSGDVTQIDDLSGNGQDSTNVSGTIKTGTTTENGLNVLDFQPGFIYDTGFIDNVWDNRAMTLAIVARVDNPSSNQALFSLPYIADQDHQTFIMKVGSGSLVFDYGTGAGFSGGSSLLSVTFGITPNTSGFHLWVVQLDTSAIALRQDGSDISISSTANSMPQNNWLIASAPGSWQWRLCARQHSSGTYAIDGIVGEVLLYPTVLNSGDVTQLETYLMGKWGI